MNRKDEKNVQAFNDDVKNNGQYLYTNFQRYSAYIATKRQSDELIKLLKKSIGKDASILDVGCGDGIFTLELLKEVKPKKIIGFDKARVAIDSATKKINIKDKKKITFRYCDIYDAHKYFKKNSFSIIVVRGVLHHVDNPVRAVASLSSISKKIIVLEPNGFNPILKLIEKISPYHRGHDEKSYWPLTLNKWFKDNGYRVKEQQYFSIIPYFCPESIVRLLEHIEPFVERLPFIKMFYCGTNLIYYER